MKKTCLKGPRPKIWNRATRFLEDRMGLGFKTTLKTNLRTTQLFATTSGTSCPKEETTSLWCLSSRSLAKQGLPSKMIWWKVKVVLSKLSGVRTPPPISTALRKSQRTRAPIRKNQGATSTWCFKWAKVTTRAKTKRWFSISVRMLSLYNIIQGPSSFKYPSRCLLLSRKNLETWKLYCHKRQIRALRRTKTLRRTHRQYSHNRYLTQVLKLGTVGRIHLNRKISWSRFQTIKQ